MFHFLPGLDLDELYYKVQTAGFSSNNVCWFFSTWSFFGEILTCLVIRSIFAHIRAIFRLTRIVVGAKIKNIVRFNAEPKQKTRVRQLRNE